MNAAKKFQKRFIQDSEEIKSPLNGVSIYQNHKSIYFLSDGLIKQKVKSQLEKLFSKNPLEQVFISLIPKRNFSFNDEILLDTYVWISSEPEHTIHYSSSPRLYLRNREKNNL